MRCAVTPATRISPKVIFWPCPTIGAGLLEGFFGLGRQPYRNRSSARAGHALAELGHDLTHIDDEDEK